MNILKTSYFKITKKDIKQAYEIEKSCKDDPTPYYETFEDFENAMTLSDSVLHLLIDNKGKVSGYVTSEPQKKCWYLSNIAIKRTCRGKGYGRLLMEAAIFEARLRSRYLTMMTLHTGADNYPMRTLVQTLNFRRIKRISKHYRNGQDCIVFEKKIIPLDTKDYV